MTNDPGTLSERIGILLEDADQLYTDIKKLRKEVDKREGIESIEYLADVPGDLLEAEDRMRFVVKVISVAEDDAMNGGE